MDIKCQPKVQQYYIFIPYEPNRRIGRSVLEAIVFLEKAGLGQRFTLLCGGTRISTLKRKVEVHNP